MPSSQGLPIRRLHFLKSFSHPPGLSLWLGARSGSGLLFCSASCSSWEILRSRQTECMEPVAAALGANPPPPPRAQPQCSSALPSGKAAASTAPAGHQHSPAAHQPGARPGPGGTRPVTVTGTSAALPGLKGPLKPAGNKGLRRNLCLFLQQNSQRGGRNESKDGLDAGGHAGLQPRASWCLRLSRRSAPVIPGWSSQAPQPTASPPSQVISCR